MLDIVFTREKGEKNDKIYKNVLSELQTQFGKNRLRPVSEEESKKKSLSSKKARTSSLTKTSSLLCVFHEVPALEFHDIAEGIHELRRIFFDKNDGTPENLNRLLVLTSPEAAKRFADFFEKQLAENERGGRKNKEMMCVEGENAEDEQCTRERDSEKRIRDKRIRVAVVGKGTRDALLLEKTEKKNGSVFSRENRGRDLYFDVVFQSSVSDAVHLGREMPLAFEVGKENGEKHPDPSTSTMSQSVSQSVTEYDEIILAGSDVQRPELKRVLVEERGFAQEKIIQVPFYETRAIFRKEFRTGGGDCVTDVEEGEPEVLGRWEISRTKVLDHPEESKIEDHPGKDQVEDQAEFIPMRSTPIIHNSIWTFASPSAVKAVQKWNCLRGGNEMQAAGDDPDGVVLCCIGDTTAKCAKSCFPRLQIRSPGARMHCCEKKFEDPPKKNKSDVVQAWASVIVEAIVLKKGLMPC